MLIPVISFATAGVLGLLFVALSINVVVQRTRTGVSLGDGAQSVRIGEEVGAAALFVASRTHANFSEYVPLSLLLLTLIELIGAPGWTVATLAGTLLLARLLHPIGMRMKSPNLFRAGGMLLQWLMLLVAAVYMLVLAPALM